MWFMWKIIFSIWRYTLLQFIMVKKIINVSFVERNFQMQENWRHINAPQRWKRSQMWLMWKSFSQSDDSKMHINSVHNGQKDHICEPCGKVFSYAGKLKRHINAVHKGQKDHMWLMWKVIFSIRKHINSIHNGWKDHSWKFNFLIP